MEILERFPLIYVYHDLVSIERIVFCWEFWKDFQNFQNILNIDHKNIQKLRQGLGSGLHNKWAAESSEIWREETMYLF